MRCSVCSVPLPDGTGRCPACGTASMTAQRNLEDTRPSVGPADGHPSSGPFVAPSAPPRFETGTVLAGRYRIVGLLGRGGMGEVYRADDLKLGRAVALKFLPEGMDRDPGRLVRFLNEVRTALRVTHPNVCRVYDVGETGGEHFLSMEYVDGEDLATLLRRIGRLPEERAIRVARQLCAGVGAAHTEGVLHRDLKPANVMIDGRGDAKITDFGIAGAVGEFEGEEIRVGTPAYMSPEQMEGREVTVRSDLYSMGLVLYELFSGKPAFEGKSLPDIARSRETDPTSLSTVVRGLDPGVGRIVDRCLATDPAYRPASAAAIAAALPGGDPLAAALAAGETPSPEMVAESGPSAGLRPGRALLLLSAALIALGGVAALSSRTVLVSRAALNLSPPVLANKASELIRAAGWGEATQDRVFEWLPNLSYYEHLRRDEPRAHRWRAFGRSRPPGLIFAYREGPRPLVRLAAGTLGQWMVDPPPTEAGMVEVQLDAEGRLRAFRATPKPFESSERSGGDVDFALFFRAAGLDQAAFTTAEPVLRPETFAGRRAAWIGHSPEADDVEVRIEAASLAGRVVEFRILDPWDRTFVEAPPPPSFWSRVASTTQSLWFVVVVVGAAVLAARNVRQGRGDQRTALRFGLYLAAVRSLWLLAAHHFATNDEIPLLTGHLAWAAYRFALAYVFYLALEPYARRLWPEMLVSWVRLFGGRFRDARVGRDLLIGVAAGCVLALADSFVTLVPEWLGLPDAGLSTNFWSWESLRGVGSALGSLAGVHVNTILSSFNGIMLLLVVRIVTRRTWVAVALVSVLAVVIFNPGSGPPWLYLAFIGVVLAVFWTVLFRAGLLSVILMLSVSDMLQAVRVSADLAEWYALPMLITYGALSAVALWGFRSAVAGRPLFRDEIQEP